ncbi:ribonuclease Z [Candidatus Woesearchaeota archaeon]|nr:ribonuclease Z [Candidatus Woesearchaeota archaeon]
MKITFLGTSCAKPTKERNHSSFFLSYGSEGILFDCGEGTQRQLTIAGIKPSKISKILISHWHGDHVLGLPGLIQTLGMSEYDKTLKIYGPKNTKKYFEHMIKSTVFEERTKVEYHEVKGIFYSNERYLLQAEKISHAIPTNGYRFVEKDKRKIDLKAVKKLGISEGPILGKLQDGKTVTHQGKKIFPKDATYLVKGKIICYLADSVPSKNSLKLAQDADILICESTYSSKLEDKAEEYRHMTSKHAGMIANQANAKKLVLTHFSTRYKDTHELEEDARNVFDDVIAAKDFMRIKI